MGFSRASLCPVLGGSEATVPDYIVSLFQVSYKKAALHSDDRRSSKHAVSVEARRRESIRLRSPYT